MCPSLSSHPNLPNSANDDAPERSADEISLSGLSGELFSDASSQDQATCEISGSGEGDSIELSVSMVDSSPLLDAAAVGSRPGESSLSFDEPKRRSPQGVPSESVPKTLGDYEIKRLIGSGGMGQVYLGEHKRMQRQVAVKVLRDERMGDEASIERFYDEVRAASRVLHPNIVTAFDAGESTGIHYLVMEYVDGLTLTRLVSKNGPVAPGVAAAIVRQAALGLLHAHRAGIIHRDVKPGNLIQAKDGTIKVLDLGLAQISNVLWSEDGRELGRIQDPDSHHKRKGKLVGTLSYMAPEQLESPDDADPRSDIYSLGAVLYFLMTGQPPYQGEYLDQVYGHRHGEIPDLMQQRSDIDLGLSNVFRRMMAKRLNERYASMDEVIDDLADYAEESHGPAWLADFVNRQSDVDVSTMSGGSTSIATSPIVGIDLGMHYVAIAEADRSDAIHNLVAGSGGQPLFRLAIADEQKTLLFDLDANQLRSTSPRQVVHCLPMYLGKDFVGRSIAGRKCPPEVLLGMAIGKVISNAMPDSNGPRLASLAIPSSYDQFHRRCMKQACRIAGLDSIRLVDRSVAAVQSLMLESDAPGVDEIPSQNLAGSETILFLGLTGQATEVALISRKARQLTQLASAGHWHTGMLRWQHRLVKLAVKAFKSTHGFDPSRSSVTASRLQMSCERAMSSLLVMPDVTITVAVEDDLPSINVSRQVWLDSCEDLIHGMRLNMHEVCKQAGLKPRHIDTCVTLGPLMRIADLRSRLLHKLPTTMEMRVVDRSDIARGAAACLAAELPQRGDLLVPPRCVSSQTIGIVVEDNKRRRRILPIIPKGTALPARSNRKVSIAKERESMTLSVVESSGSNSDQWQSLGRYEFFVDKDSSNQLKRTRLISFELNVDGLLIVRAQTPGTPESTRLATIPEPKLPLKDEADWTRWVAGLEL